MKLLTDDPHLSLYFDEERQWLYANWKGDQNYETVQDGGLKILQQVAHTRTRKILNDNREVSSAWSDAANEGGQVWFPALAAAGVEYFAWVYSKHAFSRLSADIALGYVQEGPEIAVFDNIEDAESWLEEQY